MLELGVYAAVLGAFGAISVKAPSFPQSSIAGISMGVLALLFAVQPLGSQYLGGVYAPILLRWVLLQIVVGLAISGVFARWVGKVSLMTFNRSSTFSFFFFLRALQRLIPDGLSLMTLIFPSMKSHS